MTWLIGLVLMWAVIGCGLFAYIAHKETRNPER